MRTIPWLLFVLVGCQSEAPPAPVAIATVSASASAPPAPSAAPAPPASAEPIDAGPRWALLPAEGWDSLVGRWIGVAHGDAIPGGPLGGTVVSGGARVVIVKGRAGSKTPWNLTFWAPRPGHMGADTISGGCGFYPSGVAFCRGYGLAAGAHEARIELLVEGLPNHLRVSIPGVLEQPLELRQP